MACKLAITPCSDQLKFSLKFVITQIAYFCDDVHLSTLKNRTQADQAEKGDSHCWSEGCDRLWVYMECYRHYKGFESMNYWIRLGWDDCIAVCTDKVVVAGIIHELLESHHVLRTLSLTRKKSLKMCRGVWRRKKSLCIWVCPFKALTIAAIVRLPFVIESVPLRGTFVLLSTHRFHRRAWRNIWRTRYSIH